ncbi:protein NLRC5-like [Ambystoma mexicanum]|uniref:protein NLRC5-like n=1 Tax=Ambystoma mexicanum TaxID=8296 RepID=UPI0037E7A945
MAAAVIFTVLRSKQKRQKRKTPQGEEAVIYGNPLYDPIESYKRKVLGSSVRHRKALSSGDNETDHFLPRRFHSMGSKKCSEDIEDDLSYRCEGNECKVQSEDMFTHKPSKLISRRMLITGTAGFGKSCFSNELQRQWASRQEVYYRCIILLSVSELNTIKEPISVRELLELKCPELSPLLPELLNAQGVLIILDGLDEFNHELEVSPHSPHGDSDTPQLRVSPRSPHCDIDTPLSIRSLLSKVISKQLLPSTDVLVTSEFNYVRKITNYFSSTFILEAFTEDQIQEYYNNLMAGGDLSKSFADYIETHNVSRLVSIPLIGSALCEIYREASTPGDEGALTTCSGVLFRLFQITVRNTLAKMGSWGHLCCVASTTEESGLPETITNTIHQLCGMSYKNIITGVQEIKTEDLVVNCPQAEDLLRSLRGFFFREESKTDGYIYHHSSIRDMFAALHCVEKIQDEEELEECLDTWALEKMPNNARSPLLEGITAHHGKRFQSFLRFFFGLLTSGKQSFLSQPKPLSYKRNEFLKKWFQVWIERHPIKIKLLNLFHYVFELHDADVTEHVSGCIKNMDLFNTPLNSLDIHALLYCCERSQLDVVDLRLCELGDSSLKHMMSILRSSKKAYFPVSEIENRAKDILDEVRGNRFCVCSLHFSEDMYEPSHYTKKHRPRFIRKLLPNSVPTKFQLTLTQRPRKKRNIKTQTATQTNDVAYQTDVTLEQVHFEAQHGALKINSSDADVQLPECEWNVTSDPWKVTIDHCYYAQLHPEETDNTEDVSELLAEPLTL